MATYRDAAIAAYEGRLAEFLARGREKLRPGRRVMATYRDAAIAAYEGRHAEFLARGREKLRPLMTDSTGKLVLDPLTKTAVAFEDQDAGLVVFETTDGSAVAFGVWPDRDQPVRVVELIDGAWTYRAEVRDLDDVGAVLAGGAV